MFKQGSILPIFSLAVRRTVPDWYDAGYLALGGIPPISVDWPIVSTLILPEDRTIERNQKYLTSYSIRVQAVTYRADFRLPVNSTNPCIGNFTTFTAVLDSAADRFYLPRAQADAVNSQFEPPARYDDRIGLYWVNCSAVAPVFSIVIELE